MEQGPAVAGSPVPSAPSIHVVFRTAGSAPQADEHTSASLRMGHDGHQALPLPSGGRGKPAPGAERDPHKEARPGAFPQSLAEWLRASAPHLGHRDQP